jgi:lytic murein transglycosylase
MRARVIALAALLAATLFGAVAAQAQSAASPPAAMGSTPAAPPQDPGTSPAACLAQLRTAAPQNGISVADFDRITANSRLLPATVAAAKAQPEYVEYWWDYIAKTVDDQRVADGRAVLAKSAAALAAIDEKWQVDSEPLVAIFGVETNYGGQMGKVDVLDAWLTRACTEQKPLWIKNVYASVRLLRDGTVAPDDFVGSWSGAFGMTQFIPTSFYELAADGDGDGRIDLYHSLPDALASTANHLLKRRARWMRGLPAVIEVRVPASVAAGIPAGPDNEFFDQGNRRTLAQWASMGVQRADGRPLAPAGDAALGDAQAYLFAPTGSKGPVFLATGNLDAILHYNTAHKYALAVALLVNRLQGGAGLVTPWPTDDSGLSRAEIRELQGLLAARGHDVGTPDGIPGAKTREAITAEQQRLGWPAQDGRPGQKILAALRQPG